MKKRMDKCFWAAVLAASMVLSGCSGGEKPKEAAEAKTEVQAQAETKAAETEAPKTMGRTDIIAANSSDIQSMDPAQGVDTPSALLNRNVYNGLTKLNDKKEVVGDLAESFEVADDLTYRFKLREGVKFHNGEELKASDVKFTLERCKTMPKAMSNASAIDHVTAEDDYNLTVHLSEPCPALLHILNDTSMKIVSEKAVTEAGENYGDNPVGTGPFKFKEWVPNDHWTLERFDDYFEGPAKATSITMKIIPESSAKCIALEVGEIDVAFSVDPADAENVESNSELELISHPSASVEYLGMNTQKSKLSDVRVRQAISYAIDRQAIVDAVIEGRGTIANTFVSRTLAAWNEDVQAYPHDVEKAKELLAEAGYPDGLDLMIHVSGNVRARTAEIIQAQVKEAGIDLDINVYEWGAFQDILAAGEHDLFVLGWSNTTGDADYSIKPLFHSKNVGINGNRAFLVDEELDKMIDAAAVDIDQERRNQTYKDIQVRLNELCPWVPLYYKYDMVGIRKDLKGFEYNPNYAIHYVGNCYYEN